MGNATICGCCGLPSESVDLEDEDYCTECWELIDSGEMEHPEEPDYTPPPATDSEVK